MIDLFVKNGHFPSRYENDDVFGKSLDKNVVLKTRHFYLYFLPNVLFIGQFRHVVSYH